MALAAICVSRGISTRRWTCLGRSVGVNTVTTNVTTFNTTLNTNVNGNFIVDRAVSKVTHRPRVSNTLHNAVFVNINLVRTVPVLTVIVNFLMVGG